MRSEGMSSARIVRLLTLSALACAPLHAQGTRASLTDPGAADAPRESLSSEAGAGGMAGAWGMAPLPSPDLSLRFGAISRWTDGRASCPNGFSTLDTGFESLAPLPAPLANQLDTVTWGGAAGCVTGRSLFVPPTAGWFASEIGLRANPAGSPTSAIGAVIATPVGSFFGRWSRYELFRENSTPPQQSQRYTFTPGLGQDLRVAHDAFVSSVNSLWTSEPTHVSSGFICARLLWGGTNTEFGFGLPVGPVLDLYTLYADPVVAFPFFVPCAIPRFYRSGQPYPGWNGNNPANDPTQRVPIPVGRWFRIIHETTSDAHIRHVLDLHDGAGEFVIYHARSYLPVTADAVQWSGAKETAGDAMHVDNLHIEGYRYCAGCPGDASFDCIVDFSDLNVVLSQFGKFPSGWIEGDLDNDGDVDFTDLNIVLSAFGTEC